MGGGLIIDCISDLHGNFPELAPGDLLTVAGDLTACDTRWQQIDALRWIGEQKYKLKVIIGGNHDSLLQEKRSVIGRRYFRCLNRNVEYLEDSGTEHDGLKIWGSPWTKKFPGMNERCMAFTVDTDDELAEKWALIPDDTDILITHCPAFGYLDVGIRGFSHQRAGSESLANWIEQDPDLKLHVHGHIHEGYGQIGQFPIRVNASHVNRSYDPVNEPIRIIL